MDRMGWKTDDRVWEVLFPRLWLLGDLYWGGDLPNLRRLELLTGKTIDLAVDKFRWPQLVKEAVWPDLVAVVQKLLEHGVPIYEVASLRGELSRSEVRRLVSEAKSSS